MAEKPTESTTPTSGLAPGGNNVFDPVQHQRSLCTEKILKELDRPDRPSPPRFIAVLTGASEWTPEEREQIARDQKLQEYARALREALFGPIELLPPEPVVEPSGEKGHTATPTGKSTSAVIRFLRVLPLTPRLAAESHVNSVLLISRDKAWEILVYPAGKNESTVEFLGVPPPGTPRLSVSGRVIEQVRPFDRNGFATVRSDLIDLALAKPDAALDVEFL